MVGFSALSFCIPRRSQCHPLERRRTESDEQWGSQIAMAVARGEFDAAQVCLSEIVNQIPLGCAQEILAGSFQRTTITPAMTERQTSTNDSEKIFRTALYRRVAHDHPDIGLKGGLLDTPYLQEAAYCRGDGDIIDAIWLECLNRAIAGNLSVSALLAQEGAPKLSTAQAIALLRNCYAAIPSVQDQAQAKSIRLAIFERAKKDHSTVCVDTWLNDPALIQQAQTAGDAEISQYGPASASGLESLPPEIFGAVIRQENSLRAAPVQLSSKTMRRIVGNNLVRLIIKPDVLTATSEQFARIFQGRIERNGKIAPLDLSALTDAQTQAFFDNVSALPDSIQQQIEFVPAEKPALAYALPFVARTNPALGKINEIGDPKPEILSCFVRDVLAHVRGRPFHSALARALQKLAPQALADALVPRDAASTPVLVSVVCVKENCSDQVKAYGALLKKIPETQRDSVIADVLSAWSWSGGTLLDRFRASGAGYHPANLVAYAEIVLDCIPQAQRLDPAYLDLSRLTSDAGKALLDPGSPSPYTWAYIPAIEKTLSLLPAGMTIRIAYSASIIAMFETLKKEGEQALTEVPKFLKSNLAYLYLSNLVGALADPSIVRFSCCSYISALSAVTALPRSRECWSRNDPLFTKQPIQMSQIFNE